jgi:hypothetical protein
MLRTYITQKKIPISTHDRMEYISLKEKNILIIKELFPWCIARNKTIIETFELMTIIS